MIAQSNAKDMRVQPNTHKHPLAAVKSNWREKKEDKMRNKREGADSAKQLKQKM